MMGMVDMNATEQMMVFPKPVSDKLFFQNKNIAPGQYQLSLMDVLGKEIVLFGQYIGSNTIISLYLKQFTSVIYFLQVIDRKGVLRFSRQMLIGSK